MNNLAITIDIQQRKIKLLLSKKESLTYKEYSFSKDCLSNSAVDYHKIFSTTLEIFISEQVIYPASVVFVLSDSHAVCSHIETPSFLRKKQDTLNQEIASCFKHSELFKTAFIPIDNQGTKSDFCAIMVRNSAINAVLSALNQYKFSSSKVTFESASTLASYIALKCSQKRETTLLVDVKKSFSRLVLIKDNNLIGFSSIPLGEGTKPEDLTNFIFEARDVLISKYNLSDVLLKLNFTSSDLKGIEKVIVDDSIIYKNLELYGALHPALFHKGLLI